MPKLTESGRLYDNNGQIEKLKLVKLLQWLEQFLEQRSTGFGTYEDAITKRSWSPYQAVYLWRELLAEDERLQKG